MARITDKERKEFHKLLDGSIEKLNSEKNIKKDHWNTLSPELLKRMLTTEVFELDVAVYGGNNIEILSECDDIINYAIFIKHNIMKKYDLI